MTIIKYCSNEKIDERDVKTTKCITNKHVACRANDLDKGF
jgi:hypothetical protein